MPNVNPNSLLFKNKLSAEAQAYKDSVQLTDLGKEVAIAIAFSDATVYNNSGPGAVLKVEQGVKQEEFVIYLFGVLMHICWQAEPTVRYELAKDESGKTLYATVLDGKGEPKLKAIKQPSGEIAIEPVKATVQTNKVKSLEFRT